MTATPQTEKSMRSFLTIWVGQVFSLLGSELVQFALIWYLTRETGSATVLAMATALQTLPPVLVGPFAGALIDRWNRRLTMIGADALVALATAGLAVMFWVGLPAEVLIIGIYAIMLIRSMGQTFHRPAMTATTPLMVPEQHLTRVAGFNQMLNGGLAIIAAPMGALLMEVLPMQAILAIDLVTAAIAISPLLFVHVPQPERGADHAVSGVLGDMAAGFRYVWNWRGLMIVLAMAAMINMLSSPAFTMLPLLVSEHFGKGALELGTMNSVFGIGVIVGGITLGVWGGFRKRMTTAMVGLVFLGASMAALGFLPPNGFVWAVVSMALGGIMQVMVNGSFGSAVQATVDPAMQGRVFTLIGSMAMGLSVLGLAVAGPVADALGLQVMFAASGIITMIMGLGVGLIRDVRDLEEIARARREAEADQRTQDASFAPEMVGEGAAAD